MKGGVPMHWLERHAWWLLLATALVIVVFGLGDLNASSPLAYGLIVESVRIGGVQLIAIGLFAIAVLLFGFQRNARWAWWTMWLLPLMSGMLAAIHFTTVAPGQGPAVPAYSGTLVVVLTAVALLASAPRFFRREAEPAVAGTSAA
jgi:hypothetical protein